MARLQSIRCSRVRDSGVHRAPFRAHRKVEGKLENHLAQMPANLIESAKRMSTALLRLEASPDRKPRVEDMQDCLDTFERIGHRIATHTPALRRVLEFSIGIRLSYFQERTGITGEDLKALSERLAPEAFWPTSLMMVEEWATHTVIRDQSGLRKTLYPGQYLASEPIPIWQHALPRRQGEWNQPYLEVVLHEGCIKFWAVDGRFGRIVPPQRQALDENIFVLVPTDEKVLADYRSDADNPDSDPEVQIYRKPWIRHYLSGDMFDPDSPKWWSLTITDIVSYAAGRLW